MESEALIDGQLSGDRPPCCTAASLRIEEARDLSPSMYLTMFSVVGAEMTAFESLGFVQEFALKKVFFDPPQGDQFEVHFMRLHWEATFPSDQSSLHPTNGIEAVIHLPQDTSGLVHGGSS